MSRSATAEILPFVKYVYSECAFRYSENNHSWLHGPTASAGIQTRPKTLSPATISPNFGEHRN